MYQPLCGNVFQKKMIPTTGSSTNLSSYAEQQQQTEQLRVAVENRAARWFVFKPKIPILG
jgi:hypothetical protein